MACSPARLGGLGYDGGGNEVNQLDSETKEHIHKLVNGVRIHAKNAGLSDLNILFDNIDKSLQELAESS